MLFFKIKIMFNIPIKNEFYIELYYDPFSADIVKINDVYDNMIDFNILKFKYYGNKGKQFEKSTDFFENYKWISSKDVQRFLKKSEIDEYNITPYFYISGYNVYKFKQKWFIIPESDIKPDFENYKSYLALSIGLIDHDL